MTPEEWDGLSDGDLVRHVNSGVAFTVGGNYGELGVVVTRSQLIHNCNEWDLVGQARYELTSETNRDSYPSFKGVMDRYGAAERVLAQAIANLSTNVYSTMTPEEIYEMLVTQAQEVTAERAG
jgi:hypothetical protein